MDEYRIDIVGQDNPDRPLLREFFESSDDDAACKKAHRMVKAVVTDPETQYGDLWVRDRDGGTSAEYVATISVEV